MKPCEKIGFPFVTPFTLPIRTLLTKKKAKILEKIKIYFSHGLLLSRNTLPSETLTLISLVEEQFFNITKSKYFMIFNVQKTPKKSV